MPAPKVAPRPRPELGRKVIGKRLGVMLHYDGSTSDRGALAWLQDPACKLGYNFLVWDDGTVWEIIPRALRAPHAGVTRSSDPARFPYPDNGANSAFYGVALAATSGDKATPAAVAATADLCRQLAAVHGWPLDAPGSWITTHEAEAWVRGRKHDPGAVLPLDVLFRAI